MTEKWSSFMSSFHDRHISWPFQSCRKSSGGFVVLAKGYLAVVATLLGNSSFAENAYLKTRHRTIMLNKDASRF